ncbi:MAG TPA: riboflavin synthase [Lachnospiraceae bacterium]|nr:riboflavin synthase [Lachnospiraceae bacterium]
MFTGIVEEKGKIKAIKKGTASSRLTIEGNIIFSDLKLGDSVAINGVCLTASEIAGNTFMADVMHETLKRSSLGSLTTGSTVNMERAMAAEGRFGGHIVSGHIDGTGVISGKKKDDNAVWITINTSEDILHLIVEKGSITIDGISLTVTEVTGVSFSVSVIPHTAISTTLLDKGVGDIVNLENDVIGKYVERLLGQPSAGKKDSKITRDFLSQYGF